MLRTLTLLAALGSSSASAQNCSISGLATNDVGTGAGVFAESKLTLAVVPALCRLDVFVDSFTCCNVIVSEHFLGIAPDFLPSPLPLGGRFLAGSQLYLSPTIVIGPSPGSDSSISLPTDPSLVGVRFVAQAVPVFLDTFGFSRRLGVTQAVDANFQ